jgi:hypothetical protein
MSFCGNISLGDQQFPALPETANESAYGRFALA